MVLKKGRQRYLRVFAVSLSFCREQQAEFNGRRRSICAPTRPRAKSVSCPPFAILSTLPSPFSLSRLRACLSRLPVQHVIIEPVAALCRLLQLQYHAAAASLTLAPDASLIQARRRSEDRSIFVTRSSGHARPRAGPPIDRIISKPVVVSSAFASCGGMNERSKVIKSAIVLCNC